MLGGGIRARYLGSSLMIGTLVCFVDKVRLEHRRLIKISKQKNLSTLPIKSIKMKYLSKAEKEFYNTNGFIKLENLLSESEVEEASNAYSDLFHVSFTTALQMENVHNVKWLYFIWAWQKMKILSHP